MPALDIRSRRARQESLLTIDADQEGDVYAVCVRGELGLRGSLDLELALILAENSQARRILLDLDELTSIDASGLHVLLEASRRSAGNGNRLRVTRSQSHVADLFRLTALDQTLPLTDAGSRGLRSR